MKTQIKRRKISALLNAKKGATYNFLLKNIDQLSEADLDDLIILLESDDPKKAKEIFEKRKSKIIENFFKVKQLAKKMHNMCDVLKRKKFHE